MFFKREARIGLAVKGKSCPMKRGRILSHHRDIHSLVGPGHKSHLAGKGKGIPSPNRPSSAFFSTLWKDPEAARGKATVWERGQLFAQLIP